MQDVKALPMLDKAGVVGSAVMAAPQCLEWVVRGLKGYREAAPKHFRDEYWDAAKSLESLVADSGDDEIKGVYADIFRDRLDTDAHLTDNAAHVPFMITNHLRGQLHMLGYSDAEIDQMPVNIAHSLVNETASAPAGVAGAALAAAAMEADDAPEEPVLQLELPNSQLNS